MFYALHMINYCIEMNFTYQFFLQNIKNKKLNMVINLEHMVHVSILDPPHHSRDSSGSNVARIIKIG